MKKGLILLLILTLLIIPFLFGCGPKKPKLAKVSGRVVDEKGNPVSNAEVSLDGMSDVSLEDGSFSFNDVEPGSYTLEVVKEGFEDYSEDIDVFEGDSINLDITLNKKEEKVEFKAPTDIPSYHIIVHYGPNEDKARKVAEMWKDEGGEKTKIVIYEEGGKTTELIKVGDDYAMKVGDAWSKNQPGMKEYFNNAIGEVDSYITTFKDSLKDLENYSSSEYEDIFNVGFKMEKIGKKIVNGYESMGYKVSTYKKSEDVTTPTVIVELWAISSGKYKDYITRYKINFKNPDGYTMYYRFDVLDIGEKQNISMP